MAVYSRINISERVKLYHFLGKGKSVSQIASALGCHISSIYREIKRCKSWQEYDALLAHNQATERCWRDNSKYRFVDMINYIVECLSVKRWSPEQIAGRMKLGNMKPRVSKEWIYKFIYSKPDELQLSKGLLTRQNKVRKKRRSKKGRGGIQKWHSKYDLDQSTS